MGGPLHRLNFRGVSASSAEQLDRAPGYFPGQRLGLMSGGCVQAMSLVNNVWVRCPLETGAMFGRARMVFAVFGVAACAVVLVAAAAWAAPDANPIGTWSTENGHGVIAIAQCGNALCGRIVGIDRAPADPMPTDVNGRSQCGLTIITNEKPSGDGTWLGQITDPRDGNTYQAKLWLDESGNLHLRGFIGVPLLGSTQIWRKFNGQLTGECGLA
jgi:uncharacterized protein (DUF2147 family)